MAVAGGPDIVESGLVLCLDAGNSRSYPGSGTVWYDLSGNGRNFTWDSTPTFTSAGVASYFTTLGKQCNGPASNSFGIDNTSGYTIFLVSKVVALAQNYAFYFAKSGAGDLRGISAHQAWTDGTVYFDQGGCCNANQRTSVAADTLSWNVMAYTCNITNRKIIRNGVVLTTNTTSAANIDLTTTGVIINFVTGNLNWNAQLSSFIVYNRGLTDAEVQQNYIALRGRFGI